MTDSARTPTHLWIVGGLSLLWNCFAGYDYTMSRMRNLDHLASMGGDPNQILAYMDSMAIWAQFGWGLGVWAALLGSILLLMRNRYAVHAFAASLVGMALSFGWQYFGGTKMPPEMTEGGMQYIPLVIIALGVAQLSYAWREREKGVLR